MRKRSLIGALLVVGLGVALGATVFRTDIAQATGLADKPTVTVVNTPAQAVPVREQATLQPVQVNVLGTFESGTTGSADATLYTVPAGKTLVIDSFSFNSPLAGDQRILNAQIKILGAGGVIDFAWFLPATDIGSTSFGAHLFGGEAQTTLYAGAGKTVVAIVTRGGSELEGGGALFAMSGHLVNTP